MLTKQWPAIRCWRGLSTKHRNFASAGPVIRSIPVVEHRLMNAIIFETGSRQWVRFDNVGDASFTRDKDQASVIESTQLESYIRNYELDYVRGTLTLQVVGGSPSPTVGPA